MCRCSVLKCPACGTKLRVRYQSRVKTVGCPRCLYEFPIEQQISKTSARQLGKEMTPSESIVRACRNWLNVVIIKLFA